ncbi:DUF362 domain-containing protein [candidate division KSB1 bacterium]|nr:DUF362 domain-containing protein [candidate division KSB1 bacterium]
MRKPRVFLGNCSAYHAEDIKDVIREGLSQLALTKPISGRITIKPNLVMAHPKVATDGYTRAEVIGGILANLNLKKSSEKCVKIVEKSGLGVTTQSAYRWAGYRALARQYPIRLVAMEESRRTRVVLQKSKVHPHVTVAKDLVERDFLIFAPKLKTNVLSHALSGALKLNIGSIDSKERLFHHHFDLPAKIVDLLEVANPDLIVTDGIRMSYGGNQMTQHGTDLGVLILADNAVAHDMVCAQMLNLDPHKIEHIQEAIDREYGPASLDEIEVMGDYPIEKAQAITSKLDFGFMPVDQFPSNFKIHTGTPYCTGGCHGIFLDWLHMIKDRSPGELKRFPKIPVLVGKVIQKISAKRVLLIGDCAAASPNIQSKHVVRIPGCPPTHKCIVLLMMIRLFLFAPLVRPSLIFDGFVLYPIKRIKGWLVNLRFKPELAEE